MPHNPRVPGHKLIIDGAPLDLNAQTWKCECGRWESKVPAVGPYGATTSKARIAQVEMAYGKHLKGVMQKLQRDNS